MKRNWRCLTAGKRLFVGVCIGDRPDRGREFNGNRIAREATASREKKFVRCAATGGGKLTI